MLQQWRACERPQLRAQAAAVRCAGICRYPGNLSGTKSASEASPGTLEHCMLSVRGHSNQGASAAAHPACLG